MWVTAVFSDFNDSPSASTRQASPIEQRLCLLAGPLHEDDEVIGVPDEPVGRMTPALQVLASARRAAHLLPVRLVLAVERGEGDIREQRRGNPALRGARHRPLEAARLPHQARLQERPDEPKDALVPDPPPDLITDKAVWEAVEARLDVRLHDPLIGAGREVVDLGDRVLRPTTGPVGVARRVEAGLEDRLQDELEGHLAHAVAESGDP